MRIALFFALLLSIPALAQHDAVIDRAMLERQQQADDFALRQQQTMREQSAGSDKERQRLYSEHARQRSAQERLHRNQQHRLYSLPDSSNPAAQAARRSVIQRFEQERELKRP